jgi:tetratricopeptide (TPR) repeat protein
MQKFLLILLCPCFLIGQNNTIEIDSLFDAKNYTQAVQKLEVYLSKTPQDLVLLELIGDAYGFQSNWDKAATFYKQLRDLVPNNATYHYKYGGVLGKQAKEGSKFKAIGLISKVKASLSKSAELYPTHLEVRWAMVELYTQLPGFLGGSYNKALRYANELEQLSKPYGFFAQAYIYESSNQEGLAKTYYKKGLESLEELDYFQSDVPNTTQLKSPHNALHFLVATACKIHNTRLSVGQRCVQAYIDMFSSKDNEPLEAAYMLQAQLFKLQKKTSDALSSIEKALLIKPDFKPALKEKQLILLLKP